MTNRPARRRHRTSNADQIELMGVVMLGSLLVALIGTPILFFVLSL